MFQVFFVLHRDPSYFPGERKQSFQFHVCDIVITQSQNGGLQRSPVKSLGQCWFTDFCSCAVIFSIAAEGFLIWSVCGNQSTINRNRKVNMGAQFNGGRTQQRYLLFRAVCSVEIQDLFQHDALKTG